MYFCTLMKHLYLFILLTISSLSIIARSPKEEMRAVWLTTNYGLDWPSKPFRNSNEISDQQDEMINIIDHLSQANFNTVFIQARLRGSVIYNSTIEPVSSYIQSVPNTWSQYDPLAFVVSECHKRGMECHVWFVTYPMGSELVLGQENTSPSLKSNKDKTKRYKEEFYLDPGNPDTNAYLVSLIEEIVDNYDIDGIHLDYLRYPENSADFPDNATYLRYSKGHSNKNEWRKECINRFVYETYDVIKYHKPWVQVSSSVVGFYDQLPDSKLHHWTALSVSQDPENWLAAGKHDFIVPMMYYSDSLFFPFLPDWKNRSHERLVIPGLGLFQLDETNQNWSVDKITEQIHSSRENQMGGNAFYRTRYLLDNKKNILSEIAEHFYQRPALLPRLTWLDSIPPLPPQQLDASISGVFLYLCWQPVQQPDAKAVYYNVYRSETWPVDSSNTDNLVAARVPNRMLFIPINQEEISGYYYAVTAYDRYHNESTLSEPVYFATGRLE